MSIIHFASLINWFWFFHLKKSCCLREIASEKAIGRRVRWINVMGSHGINELRKYEQTRSLNHADKHSPATASLLLDTALTDLSKQAYFNDAFVSMLFTVLEQRHQHPFPNTSAYDKGMSICYWNVILSFQHDIRLIQIRNMVQII